MKKILLLFSLLSLFAFNSFAQESSVDMVILKDGSVIKGEIINNNKEDSVEIKTQAGTLLLFSKEEIDSIRFNVKTAAEGTKEKVPKKDREPHIHKEKGMYGALTLGFLPNFGSKYSSPGVGRTLSFTLGYRIHPMANIGLGYGGNFDQFDFNDNNYMIYYFEYRANLMEKSFTPYAAIKAGYGTNDFLPFDGYNDGSGGLMLNPAIGVQLPSKRKLHFDLSIGYLLQGDDFYYYDTDTNQYKSARGFLHLLGLYAGFSF